MSPARCHTAHLGDVGLADEHCFFEGALSVVSSTREPRGVEEREFFVFVFVLIGIACASALTASLAS